MRLLARHSEVAAHDLGLRVVLAEDAHKIGEGLLVQRDGPAQVPRVLVGVGEVVAGAQGVGVVLAQDPLPVGEGLLVQRDGPAQVPRVLVGVGEVVAGGEGLGVVLAEDPHEIGEGLLVQGDAVTALAARAASHASLDNPWAVAGLLRELREAGDSDAVTALAARAANAGMFDVFLEVRPDEASSYRFGREPDGTPSQSWNWQEPASQNHGLRTRQPDA